jgi:hypothetical protein
LYESYKVGDRERVEGGLTPGHEIAGIVEEQIFGEVEEDIASDISLIVMERPQRKYRRSQSSVQRNQSLAKYLLSYTTLRIEFDT